MAAPTALASNSTAACNSRLRSKAIKKAGGRRDDAGCKVSACAGYSASGWWDARVGRRRAGHVVGKLKQPCVHAQRCGCAGKVRRCVSQLLTGDLIALRQATRNFCEHCRLCASSNAQQQRHLLSLRRANKRAVSCMQHVSATTPRRPHGALLASAMQNADMALRTVGRHSSGRAAGLSAQRGRIAPAVKSNRPAATRSSFPALLGSTAGQRELAGARAPAAQRRPTLGSFALRGIAAQYSSMYAGLGRFKVVGRMAPLCALSMKRVSSSAHFPAVRVAASGARLTRAWSSSVEFQDRSGAGLNLLATDSCCETMGRWRRGAAQQARAQQHALGLRWQAGTQRRGTQQAPLYPKRLA